MSSYNDALAAVREAQSEAPTEAKPDKPPRKKKGTQSEAPVEAKPEEKPPTEAKPDKPPRKKKATQSEAPAEAKPKEAKPDKPLRKKKATQSEAPVEAKPKEDEPKAPTEEAPAEEAPAEAAPKKTLAKAPCPKCGKVLTIHALRHSHTCERKERSDAKDFKVLREKPDPMVEATNLFRRARDDARLKKREAWKTSLFS